MARTSSGWASAWLALDYGDLEAPQRVGMLQDDLPEVKYTEIIEIGAVSARSQAITLAPCSRAIVRNGSTIHAASTSLFSNAAAHVREGKLDELDL